MSYVHTKFEGLAQKIMPDLVARVVSGLFYLIPASLVVIVTQALLGEGIPAEGVPVDAVQVCTDLFLAGTLMHSAIVFTLAGRFSVRPFVCIAAAWGAPLLLLLSWGTV